ncbi:MULTISPECIES: type VI secretion system baseplate subunit TssK [Klebsiella]|nr:MULTISPECIES: type VI secretion system baseplate subunit TssK [Klebsiella]MDX6056212.1 type VI secretion system baseplate subunit TssK [Klebsiella sp. JN_Kp126]
MKTVRPLWGRGQMVSPQHFQQEAAQAAWHTECVARLGVIHPWGVARTAFDAALLKQGKLKADHLCVRFADGTLTDSDNADVLPPVMTLPETESHELTVVLALPHEYENGGNCLQPEQKAERPVRWRLAWREVRNRYGDDSRQIAVMQPELTLRTEDNDNGNYQTVAVARLKRDSQGDWSQDASFIPPLLNVQASRWLCTLLIRSERTVSEMRSVLIKAMHFTDENHRRHILRYYDPRVLFHLSWMFTYRQLMELIPVRQSSYWTLWIEGQWHTLVCHSSEVMLTSVEHETVFPAARLKNIGLINRVLMEIPFITDIAERRNCSQRIEKLLSRGLSLGLTHHNDLIAFACSGLTREPDFWRIPIIQEWLRCAEKTPELFSRMINGLSDIEWQTLLLQQERYKENNHE